MNGNIEAMGMSAAERDVRERIAGDFDQGHHNENVIHHIPGGVLHTLMRDLDMWREIVTADPDKWSFDALVAMAKRLLDQVYPDDVFVGDPNKLFEIARVVGNNSGVHFVVLLRWLIAVIEAGGTGGPVLHAPIEGRE